MADMPSDERRWFIAERWQEYEGEGRANVLRIGAIGAFYLVHLFQHYGWLTLEGTHTPADSANGVFHQQVTALAASWTMAALAVLLCLRQRFFPGWLKYVSTATDLVFLTAILCIASGPRSPLVLCYPLVILLAGLRFSLTLVRCATAGSLLGYLVVLGAARWPERFGLANVEQRVPRYQQLITLLAIALAGILLGQIVRRARRLAEDFATKSG